MSVKRKVSARAASERTTYRESDPVNEELTPAQLQELRRRMADLDDATRYLLVSQMGPRFALYYNVSDDVYVMNDPRGATLFKRHEAALAVKALLGGSIRILRCKGKRVVRIPYKLTTGGIVPPHTRIIWPYACTPRR